MPSSTPQFGQPMPSPDPTKFVIKRGCDSGAYKILNTRRSSIRARFQWSDGRQTPFIVAGNGGHAIVRLTKKGMPALRRPANQDGLSDGTDQVVFENYDDRDFGYLRVVANSEQLRLEFHPASDGTRAKTPDDSMTVDLKSRQIVYYTSQPN